MKNKHRLSKSSLIEAIPLACFNELAAVEFFETRRWGKTPCCVHCGSVDVHKMVNSKTGQRNARYLWRCHDCKKQYTVRIGAVYEESRLPMRHWAYAFWRASTSKKGVSALEIMRNCQISYKSALFLLNRIRFAMAPKPIVPNLLGRSSATKPTLAGSLGSRESVSADAAPIKLQYSRRSSAAGGFAVALWQTLRARR